MQYKEIEKRLVEFAEYLDNMNSGLDKGKLSKFFVGYLELSRKYQFVKALKKKIGDEKHVS